MKIKAVCEATGLTDRTIRHYISEELISPDFTENYLGRKNFDFSESDIKTLNDISVLRKFGFAINEIKTMLLAPESIAPTVELLYKRKRTSLDEEQKHIRVLDGLNIPLCCDVSSLATQLSSPVAKASLPSEDFPMQSRTIYDYLKKILIFVVTWLPVALTLYAFFDCSRYCFYPTLSPLVLLVLFILLLPTILTVASGLLGFGRNLRAALLVMCLLAAPLCLWTVALNMSSSETDNHHHYRQFDQYCPANTDTVFQELFPGQLEYSEPKYHYSYSTTLFGTSCDIFAQWQLEPERLDAEVARVEQWYRSYGIEFLHTAIEFGDYSCFILYEGSPPFQAAQKDYTHYIFACNKQTGQIRYIYCCSDLNAAVQPYYLSLDW